MKLGVKRILAFSIDYVVIVIYALLLFGITTLISPSTLSPSEGQLIGFLTLTLPVFLYFYLMENSKFKRTIGKKFMKISVRSDHKTNGRPILIRNLLKFLPWEIAHIGVHWMVYYSGQAENPPIWIWIILILPQLIVLAYAISIMYYKGQSSIYDNIAGTVVEQNRRNRK